MQLPSTDALVLASGCAPLRVKKARYYADRQLKGRVLPPPASRGEIPGGADVIWTAASAPAAAERSTPGEADDGGLRQEQDPEAPDVLAPTPVVEDPSCDPLGPGLDDDEGVAVLPDDLEARMRRVARQAALDPDDGIAL